MTIFTSHPNKIIAGVNEDLQIAIRQLAHALSASHLPIQRIFSSQIAVSTHIFSSLLTTMRKLTKKNSLGNNLLIFLAGTPIYKLI